MPGFQTLLGTARCTMVACVVACIKTVTISTGRAIPTVAIPTGVDNSNRVMSKKKQQCRRPHLMIHPSV